MASCPPPTHLQVSVPTLVVWGRNDEILDPQNAEKFMEALPDAQLVWLDECGHCAHLEQPQRLFEAVAAFVKSREGQGSSKEGGMLQGAAP